MLHAREELIANIFVCVLFQLGETLTLPLLVSVEHLHFTHTVEGTHLKMLVFFFYKKMSAT
jgi:hypothetical protein